MKKIVLFPLLFLVIAVLVILIMRNTGASSFRLAGSAMDTNFEIVVYGENAKAKSLSTQKIIKTLSDELSWFNPDTPVSRINARAGKSAVRAEAAVLEVLLAGKKAHKESQGAFDLAIGPLVKLWKTASQTNALPAEGKVAKAAALCLDQDLIVDSKKQTAFLKKTGMALNLGGIAKGFAVAKAMEQLKAEKAKAAMVNMGSSIAVLGEKPDGSSWRIGVKHPRQTDKVVGILTLKGGQSLGTSGDYEREYVIEGKHFSHIINPKTGYPANGCQSVTVISNDPLLAEIYSTAIFVMGPWEGLRFAHGKKDTEVLIVKADGNLITSPGLKFERETNL